MKRLTESAALGFHYTPDKKYSKSAPKTNKKHKFSGKESRIWDLRNKGLSYIKIAKELEVDPRTVQSYLARSGAW